MTDGEHRDDQIDQLRVEREHRDDAVVVRVLGEVDSTTADLLRDQLAAALAATEVPVVVDLTDVAFFASVGMAVLVEHHRLGARRGTPLRVVAPAASPLRALRATRLDLVLDLYPDLEAALAAGG